jgi:hypothetical protein
MNPSDDEGRSRKGLLDPGSQGSRPKADALKIELKPRAEQVRAQVASRQFRRIDLELLKRAVWSSLRSMARNLVRSMRREFAN